MVSIEFEEYLWNELEQYIIEYIIELPSHLTHLLRPENQYPSTRKIKRKIYLHIGPTNSGKTFQGLKHLLNSKTGIYCGPLRLLAQQVYEILNNNNISSDLITGPLKIIKEESSHVSCTTEMADLSRLYDCAVIDEVQLVSDTERGWAWTRVILGLQAKEIHLCGNESSLSLVQRILRDRCREHVDISHYQRLSPLVPLTNSVSLARLSPGDCVIAFSKKELYSLRKQIEELTSYKTCIVYGNLPPEVRTHQAELFNDPNSNYKILLATDAVGLGLNLNIKRVIFQCLEKFDGNKMRDLFPSEIKQIAGRAGRYGTEYPRGEVSCLKRNDLPYLHWALGQPNEPDDV